MLMKFPLLYHQHPDYTINIGAFLTLHKSVGLQIRIRGLILG